MRTLIWQQLISRESLITDLFPNMDLDRNTLKDFYEMSDYDEFVGVLERILPSEVLRVLSDESGNTVNGRRLPGTKYSKARLLSVFPFELFYHWLRRRPTRSIITLVWSLIRRELRAQIVTKKSLILPLFPNACEPASTALSGWSIERFYVRTLMPQWFAYVLMVKLTEREKETLYRDTGIVVDNLAYVDANVVESAQLLDMLKREISFDQFVDICKR